MPHFNKPESVVLSDEQFSKLVELLTPGYELGKMYLAQAQAQMQAVAEAKAKAVAEAQAAEREDKPADEGDRDPPRDPIDP